MYYKKSTTEPDKIKTALTRLGHKIRRTHLPLHMHSHIKQNNIYFNYVIHIYSKRGGH